METTILLNKLRCSSGGKDVFLMNSYKSSELHSFILKGDEV